jgi:MFS-type transporter involved in bile tolerance (Atg22 family)
MTFCTLLAVFSYILIILPVHPVINLIGCVLSGLAVGSLYPSALSLGSALLPAGGTAMFAFMAVAGDIGCSIGPSMVGTVSGWFGDELKFGFAVALLFPVLFLMGLMALHCSKK